MFIDLYMIVYSYVLFCYWIFKKLLFYSLKCMKNNLIFDVLFIDKIYVIIMKFKGKFFIVDVFYYIWF